MAGVSSLGSSEIHPTSSNLHTSPTQSHAVDLWPYYKKLAPTTQYKTALYECLQILASDTSRDTASPTLRVLTSTRN
jgi:hypothetical protein